MKLIIPASRILWRPNEIIDVKSWSIVSDMSHKWESLSFPFQDSDHTHLFLCKVIPESLWRSTSPFVLASTHMHIHVRGPPDHPQFDDSLAGLTELSKAVILMDVVSYGETIQIKISKWKRYIGWRPGRNHLPACRCPQPEKSCRQPSFSQQGQNSIHKVVPTREIHWALGFRFCWRLVTQVYNTSVTALSYSVSSPLKVKPLKSCGPGPQAYKKSI